MLNFKSMLHLMQQKTYRANLDMAHSIAHTKTSKIGIKSLVRVFALSGILMSCAYAGGKADDYMRVSISNTFDNLSKFECEGGERSAICKIDRYEFSNTDGFALLNYRYTVDYKDTRVIERISGDIESPSNYDLKIFVPKHFECSDFTQLHNEKQQVGGQLVCSIDSDTYKLQFRLRAKAHAPIFANVDSIMSLLQKGITFINKTMSSIQSADDNRLIDGKLDGLKELLNTVNVNVYGLDIALTKPNLPQKIYEHVFSDSIYDDEYDSLNSNSRNSKILYNSTIGYIYGNAMGYVWGNDTIDSRTKESLSKVFTTLRDSAMLDSNIHTVYIKITNRTNKGFNLGRALDKMKQGAVDLHNPNKDQAGKILNLFDGDVFNRYRIEVGATRFK